MTTAKAVIDVVTNSFTCDSTTNNNKVEEGALERCVKLLEHAGECRGVCLDRQHCYRACRVLLHHRACATAHCSVCRQLEPLCHLHARRCQKKDKSCNMPLCPNGKELLRVLRSSETSTTPCVPRPQYIDRALFTQVKSADLLKGTVVAEDKNSVTSTNDKLSITSPLCQPAGLKKRHLSDKKLRWPNSYCKLPTKEAIQASIFSWKAKVSIVPMI